MKILITGSTGQVGHALVKNLRNHQIVALTRKDCDLSKPDEIKRLKRKISDLTLEFDFLDAKATTTITESFMDLARHRYN